MKSITRPTTQKIREAIFNILGAKTSGAFFLDLFAGTGLVGIDAYLYGAEKVVLVENNHNAVKTIKKNIGGLAASLMGTVHRLTNDRDSPHINLPVPDPIILIKQDAIKFLKNCDRKFDIIFIDPPYETMLGDEALKIIDERQLLNKDGIIIFEHYHKKEFLLNLHNISIIKEKKYGQTKLTFLKNGD